MKKCFKKIAVVFVLLFALITIPFSFNQDANNTEVKTLNEESFYTQELSALTSSSMEDSLVADSINNGNIFHAWNWSMKTIEANLDSIKNAGFTTIQTSPMQPQKDYYATDTQRGSWWKLYQPLGFSIATKNNALGTKSDLVSMVKKAHNKGLKVIVDVVANHLAGDYDRLAPAVKEYEPTIYGYDGTLSGGAMLHSETLYEAQDAWHTTNGHIGLPDLNTHHQHVQQRALSLVKEYIDCDVDGFRFDAAKHIETDNQAEPNGASQFWPTVINGATSYAKSKGKETPYYYGEILYTVGSYRSYDWYTKYMDVIDNTCGNDLRENFNKGIAACSNYYSATGMQSGERCLVWAESHDTYANEKSESTNTSIYNINKTYAIMGARNGAKALYLARPTDSTGTSAWNNCTRKLGEKGSVAYTYSEVSAVNKFRNYFGTSAEYLNNASGFAQVVRYNSKESGMVLVSASSSTNVSNVSVPNKMKDGTYKDLVSGNEFTVANSKVSGKMSNSGIAVLKSTSQNPGPDFNKDTIYFVNTKNWSNVYLYAWEGAGGNGHQLSSWPGVKMTKTGKQKDGHDIYSYTSSNLLEKWDHVIFTNNSGSQTKDLDIMYNLYDFDGNSSIYTDGGFVTTKDKIYFVNNKKWSNVYIYAWEGTGGNGHQLSSWPGVKMTKTGKKLNGYDLYVFEDTNFYKNWENVIFTNGSGSQTKDITITTNCYNVSGSLSTYTE